MPNQSIRITLKAYDHRVLDLSAQQILEAAERTGAAVAGPIPMPTSIRRFCVLRSPHVNKKSREHFELRIHKRIIDILEERSENDEILSYRSTYDDEILSYRIICDDEILSYRIICDDEILPYRVTCDDDMLPYRVTCDDDEGDEI